MRKNCSFKRKPMHYTVQVQICSATVTPVGVWARRMKTNILSSISRTAVPYFPSLSYLQIGRGIFCLQPRQNIHCLNIKLRWRLIQTQRHRRCADLQGWEVCCNLWTIFIFLWFVRYLIHNFFLFVLRMRIWPAQLFVWQYILFLFFCKESFSDILVDLKLK